MTDDDEHPDLEGLSEDELERVFQSEYKQLNERLALLSRDELIRWKVSVVLRTCVSWRRVLREFNIDFARTRLKERQRRLVALRIERKTGHVVGGTH